MTQVLSKLGIAGAIALTLSLGACNTPGDRALGGGAIGGLAGAGIGGLAGGGRGALIGGLAGAATGAVVGAATTPTPAYGPGYGSGYGYGRPAPAYSAGPVVYRGAPEGPYYEDYGYGRPVRPYAVEERRYYGGY